MGEQGGKVGRGWGWVSGSGTRRGLPPPPSVFAIFPSSPGVERESRHPTPGGDALREEKIERGVARRESSCSTLGGGGEEKKPQVAKKNGLNKNDFLRAN